MLIKRTEIYIFFNSWTNFLLNNRQQSKALNLTVNRENWKIITVNGQTYDPMRPSHYCEADISSASTVRENPFLGLPAPRVSIV